MNSMRVDSVQGSCLSFEKGRVRPDLVYGSGTASLSSPLLGSLLGFSEMGIIQIIPLRVFRLTINVSSFSPPSLALED